VTLVHLVRHGHVENPQKIVYGRRPGFHLSARGRAEAEAVAAYLGTRPVVRVYTSPLERARETAETIGRACGCEVLARDDLLEAQLCEPWEGMKWREVRTRQVAGWMRYLVRPHEIRNVPEDLAALAARMAGAVRAIASAHPEQEVVAVSHGDPIKAGVIALTAAGLSSLHRRTVPTGGLVTLAVDDGSVEVRERWAPHAVKALP
jgi:broad specificity phosphatase PhoE